MELQLARRTDWNAWARLILLLGLTALLTRLIITGQISAYIHPRFTWFTASAGIGMLLMAAGQLMRGLQGLRGFDLPLRSRLYTAMTAVICVGFIIRPHTFGADLALKQGLNVTKRSTAAAAAPAAAALPAEPAPVSAKAPGSVSGGSSTGPPPGASDPKPAPASPSPPAQSAAAPPDAAGDNTPTIITPQTFVKWMTEFYADHYKYAGKRIVMDGFTFYPPDMEAMDSFAVVRLVVTCHVAHAFPDGLLAVSPGKARPAQDTWHRVEGILEPYVYQGKSTLRLKLTSLTPISAPTDPYVYP